MSVVLYASRSQLHPLHLPTLKDLARHRADREIKEAEINHYGKFNEHAL